MYKQFGLQWQRKYWRDRWVIWDIRKWLCRSKKDCTWAGGNKFESNNLQYVGISQLAISKVAFLEESMEGKYLVITNMLTIHNREIQMHLLMDYGATGMAFIYWDIASHHLILWYMLGDNSYVKAMNARPIQLEDIVHLNTWLLTLHNYKDQFHWLWHV